MSPERSTIVHHTFRITHAHFCSCLTMVDQLHSFLQLPSPLCRRAAVDYAARKGHISVLYHIASSISILHANNIFSNHLIVDSIT